MILQYASSNGNVFDLKAGHFRTRTGNYHDFTWTPKAITQQYGERVWMFDKKPVTYSTLITVFGSLDERRTFLNLLHAAFDHDIRTMTPGRIVHGMYYVDCFITSSKTYYSAPWTQNELQIYCPYPFWIREDNYRLRAAEAGEYEYLDYPYDYPYDYTATLPGYGMIRNSGEGAADFVLKLSGAVNPLIVIGKNRVGVNAAIGSNETLIISSKDKTVVKETPTGTINLFNSRIKDGSIFEKIPSGENAVMWSGLYDIDLTLYEERSEPLWI